MPHSININRLKQIALTSLLVFTTNLLIIHSTLAQQPEKTASDYVNAGVAAQKAGKCEEALQHYAAALKLDPKNFGANFNSGSCYMALRKGEEALSFLKTAVALKPDDAIV